MLHITTTKHVDFLEQYALLYFLDGIEQFASKFRDAGWVPSFDITIDGFIDGQYFGFFSIDPSRPYKEVGVEDSEDEANESDESV